ncbi:MAG: phosphoglycolate phosphatase [Hyphomicrobium sp.]
MKNLTLVFDLDGTLVDTAPDLVGATNHVLADIGLSPIEEVLLRPWISFGARRMIIEALRYSHRVLTEQEVDRLFELFIRYYEVNIARDSRPYPGLLLSLDTLRAAGARLAVCTNKRESLSRALLEALHINQHFSAIAGRDTFDVHKPHPDHLKGAIRLAGGNEEEAIMVGDSDVDVATAKAAGIPIIAVSFGYTQVPVATLEPNSVIDHYDNLIPAIRKLLPLTT